MADVSEDEEFISLSSSDSEHVVAFERTYNNEHAIDSDTEDRILAQVYYSKDPVHINFDFTDNSSKISSTINRPYVDCTSPTIEQPRYNEATASGSRRVEMDNDISIISDDESKLSKYSIVRNQVDVSIFPPASDLNSIEDNKLIEQYEIEDINVDDNDDISLEGSVDNFENEFQNPDDISIARDAPNKPYQLRTHRVNIQLENDKYNDEISSEDNISGKVVNRGNMDSDMEEVDMGDVDIQDDSRRYFLSATSSGPTCFSCGLKGHIRAECPQENDPDYDKESNMACIYCGKKGHTKHNCPQDICYKCGRLGHQSRRCPIQISSKESPYLEKKKINRKVLRSPNGVGFNWSNGKIEEYDGDSTNCGLCGLPSHRASECSIRWRQYVFHDSGTIGIENPASLTDVGHSLGSTLPTPQQVEQAYKKIKKGCYYCASSKHFGDDCSSRLRKKSFYPLSSSANGSMEWSAFNEYSYKYVRAALLQLPNLNLLSSSIHFPYYEVSSSSADVVQKSKGRKINKPLSSLSEPHSRLKIPSPTNLQRKQKIHNVNRNVFITPTNTRQRYIKKDTYIPGLTAQQQSYLSSNNIEGEGYEPLIPSSTGNSPEEVFVKSQPQRRVGETNELFVFKHGNNFVPGNFRPPRHPHLQRTMPLPPGTRGNPSFSEQRSFTQPPPYDTILAGSGHRQPTLYFDADEPYYPRSSPAQEYRPHYPPTLSDRFKQNYQDRNQISHRNNLFYLPVATPPHPPVNHQGLPGNLYTLQNHPSFTIQNHAANPSLVPDYGSPPAVLQSSVVSSHPFENHYQLMPPYESPQGGSAAISFRNGHNG